MTERLHFHFSLSSTGEGNGNPLQCSCLENPRDGGAWWAAVYGVAQSRTRLKRLSSSSSSCEARRDIYGLPTVPQALNYPLMSERFALVSIPILRMRRWRLQVMQLISGQRKTGDQVLDFRPRFFFTLHSLTAWAGRRQLFFASLSALCSHRDATCHRTTEPVAYSHGCLFLLRSPQVSWAVLLFKAMLRWSLLGPLQSAAGVVRPRLAWACHVASSALGT